MPTGPADPRDPRPLSHDVEVEVCIRVHDSGEDHRFSFVERGLRSGSGRTYRAETHPVVDTLSARAVKRALDFLDRSYPPLPPQEARRG